MNDFSTILDYLHSMTNPENVAGMARFGINSQNTLGISMPVIRNLAKSYKKRHDLALELWESGIHEARILAALIDDPKLLNNEQMEKWVSDFDSWDICDQVCLNLFRKIPLAWDKAIEWHNRKAEFEKRAGFVMMATLAVSEKKASDERFYPFFQCIYNQANDERNMVKKAVNWALRQIGKRNLSLNGLAVNWCDKIKELDSKPARWIASDAKRELTNPKVTGRLMDVKK